MKQKLELVVKNLDDLVPYENNPRKNEKAIHVVSESIQQCGYISPIIIDENNVILAGHTRYNALRSNGEDSVQVIVVSGLMEEQKKKYRLLDNKTSEFSSWDFDLLAEELEGLDFGDLQIDWGITGFTDEELARLIDENAAPKEKEKWKVTVKCKDESEHRMLKEFLDENRLEYSPNE